MREAQSLPTQAFSSLFRATELEDRIEFWTTSATASTTRTCSSMGCTTSGTISITVSRS